MLYCKTIHQFVASNLMIKFLYISCINIIFCCEKVSICHLCAVLRATVVKSAIICVVLHCRFHHSIDSPSLIVFGF